MATLHSCQFHFITARKRSLQRLCFYTCLSFCPWRGGVCLSACWDTTPPGPATPRSRHPLPPGPGTPRERTPPQSRHLQGQDPPEQAPPGAVHAGRYGQRAGGMHHTGMQSCCLCKQNKNVSFFGISFNKTLDHAILCKRLRNGSPSHFTCSVQLRVNGSPQRMRHGCLKREHYDLYESTLYSYLISCD